MRDAQLPELLTLFAVASWLRITSRAVQRMARVGQIPSITLPTGDVVFERAALQVWLAQRRELAAAVQNGGAA